MAVLYRSHFHALELQLELTRRNIPFSITSGIRFFEQAHIKDVTAYLKLVTNPRDELVVQAARAIAAGHWRQGRGQAVAEVSAEVELEVEIRTPNGRRAEAEDRADARASNGPHGCDTTPTLQCTASDRAALAGMRGGRAEEGGRRLGAIRGHHRATGSGRTSGTTRRKMIASRHRSRLRGLPEGELRQLPLAAGRSGTAWRSSRGNSNRLRIS